MSILTGDIKPTFGEVYVAGYDVSGKTTSNVEKARKNIGYCPQINPLLELMTARETLHMFGSSRGIKDESLVWNKNYQITMNLTFFKTSIIGPSS